MIKSTCPFNKSKTFRITYNRELKHFIIDVLLSGEIATTANIESVYAASEFASVEAAALDSLILTDKRRLSTDKKDYTTIAKLSKNCFNNKMILVEKNSRLEFEHVEADSYHRQPAKSYVSYTKWDSVIKEQRFITLDVRLDLNMNKIYMLEYRSQFSGYIYDVKRFKTIKDVKEFLS